MQSSLFQPVTKHAMMIHSTVTTLLAPNVRRSFAARRNTGAFVRSLRSSSDNQQTAFPASTRSRMIPLTKAKLPACETPDESTTLLGSSSPGQNDDALSRYPNMLSPGGVLRGLDYLGTISFALTGSITAAQSGLDIFGCTMVGTVTAVGGGTIRDAVFLLKRPFWTLETEYIWMAVCTGLVTFFAWPFVIAMQETEREKKIKSGAKTEDIQYDKVDIFLHFWDSIGLGAFAIIGAQNGIRAGVSMVVSAICGMCTATFGGMTRDVLCGRPVRIIHSNAEVYALPALAGATTYLIAKRVATTPSVRIVSALSICIGSRYFAMKNDVKLYTWDTKNDGLGVSVRK